MTAKALFRGYPQIDWDKIKRMRDIISHHYFDVDAEIIFDVCKNHIDDLEKAISQMLMDLSQG